ncbi:hypothetical protein ACIQVL_17405 [Streptomyces sp. NPDC090499]
MTGSGRPFDLTALLAEAVRPAARRHPSVTYRLAPAPPAPASGSP